jgi:hypothetical protein
MVSSFEKPAFEGDHKAPLIDGTRLCPGDGVPKDEAKGMVFFKSSADQESVEAQ